jgi:acyl dehydratase
VGTVASQAVELNTEAVVTESTINELKEMMLAQSPDWLPSKRQWHYEATRDTIRHWAWGIGDDNPLWVDRAYGATTRFGTNLAPPTFLYSAAAGPMHENSSGARRKGKGGPLAGIHAVWAKEDWTWHRPIIQGMTTLCSEGKTVDVIAHESKFGGLVAEVLTEHRFFTDTGELLGSKRISFMHFGRKTAAKRGKYADMKRHVWSDEELEALLADIDLERVRGAEDLRWDDVLPGETLPHVVKGPLSGSEVICFWQGWGGSYRAASEIAHKYIRKHPKVNVPDRVGRFPEFPGRVHIDPDFARECGFPDAYDIGAQRASWVASAVTNWMGDNALLKHFGFRLLRLNIIGDATWVTGSVVGKRIDDDGQRVIDLVLSGKNQRGEETISATATVVPPR